MLPVSRPFAAHPLAVGLAALLLGAGCGVRKGAPEWIGSESAVVRCVVAGPNLQLPPLLDEVPSPAIPSGLFARAMDPVALDQLGYERDRVVCATLLAPDAARLDAASSAIDDLLETRIEVGKRARKLGRCVCTQADALGARELVPGCIGQPVRQGCATDPEQLAELSELLAPLQAKLATTEIPRVHWRLFGRTDRPGRFVEYHEDLLDRHTGGADVYLRRTALPPMAGFELVRGLLALEHVVAVVREDGNRALLVVREIDDQLIFDHFAYPNLAGPETELAGARAGGIDVELLTMLPRLDDAQLAWYRDALEPPTQTRELLFEPRDGYMVEVDRAALERVDASLIVAARFAGQSYDEAIQTRVLPPLLVDRFAHQVPYGTEGLVLHARARLTDQGRQWLGGVADLSATEALAGLGHLDVRPSFRPATEDGVARLFLLRGRPSDHLLFAGANALPRVLTAIAASAPGSIDGDIDDFVVELPSGPMPGVEGEPGAEALRERLSITPHRLELELVEGGRVIAVELQSR
jgi:hypothetical protein